MKTATIRRCHGLVMMALMTISGISMAQVAPDEEVQKLIQSLQDKDAIVRLRAAKSLGEMGARAQPAIDALTRALEDEDQDVSLVARRALDRIQVQTNPELTRLMADLTDPDALKRLQAAKRLGDLGVEAAPALAALEQALQDEDEDVRRVARHAIEKIRSSGNAEVRRLVEQLQDQDPMVRLSAAKRLGDMGAEALPAVEALQAAREDPDEVVRMVVRNAIKKLERSGTIVVDRGGSELTDAVQKITIARLERIFSPPETNAGGFLGKPGSMRFFVTLKNTARQAVQIGTLRVRWFMGQEEIDNTDVEGPLLPLLPGQASIHTFALRWNQDSKWDERTKAVAEVALATPLDLDRADQLKLEAVRGELGGLQVVNPRPIYSFGVLMGDQFTIENSNGRIAKGVLIALRGYDMANDWVYSPALLRTPASHGVHAHREQPVQTGGTSVRRAQVGGLSARQVQRRDQAPRRGHPGCRTGRE